MAKDSGAYSLAGTGSKRVELPNLACIDTSAQVLKKGTKEMIKKQERIYQYGKERNLAIKGRVKAVREEARSLGRGWEDSFIR